MLKNLYSKLNAGVMLRGTLLCAGFMAYSLCAQAQATFMDWSFDPSAFEDDRFQFGPGQVKSVIFTVEMQRGTNSNGDYVPVSESFKVVRIAPFDGIYDVSTQTFTISTADFGNDAFASKTFTVSITAVGGSSSGNNVVRTNDEVALIFTGRSSPPANLNPYVVHVQLPQIGGNVICCSKCIGQGEPVGTLGTAPGWSVNGGDKVYKYQWQGSTDGTNFNDIHHEGPAGIDLAQNASYSPGTISATTWYRRVVTSSSASSPNPISPAVSAAVKVEFLDALQSPTIPATTYTQDKTVKAIGNMVIQGDQYPVGDITIDFISDTQIIIAPSSIIWPNTTLSIGPLCGASSGRIASPTEFQQAANPPAEIEMEQIPAAATDETAIRVYPNPAQGVIHVALGTAAITDGKVIVLDKFSNVVLTADITVGDHTVTLNLDALPSDTYYMKVISMDQKPTYTRFLVRN